MSKDRTGELRVHAYHSELREIVIEETGAYLKIPVTLMIDGIPMTEREYRGARAAFDLIRAKNTLKELGIDIELPPLPPL